MIAKLAELIVCGAPKMMCAEGLPRRREVESSTSSSIREALWRYFAIDLTVCTAGIGAPTQTFIASIRKVHTSLEGELAHHSNGSITTSSESERRMLTAESVLLAGEAFSSVAFSAPMSSGSKASSQLLTVASEHATRTSSGDGLERSRNWFSTAAFASYLRSGW